MSAELEHWKTIQGMLRGYRATSVLATCAQLGLFEHLAAGGLTAEELGKRVNAAPQALRRLLDAGVALDLFEKEAERYCNAPMATACLSDPGGSYFLGNYARREGAFYQRWGYLTEAVRTGQRPEANVRDEGSGNWVMDFELALYDLARTNGPVIAEALSLPSDRPLRLVDVGGGHGGYSMALCRRYPNITATVYELSGAAEVARTIIDEAGMRDRVSVQDGDFKKEEIGRDYDLALLFGVLVSEPPAGKLELLRKTYRSLKPGGQVVIRGFWLDDDRAGPPEATLFSLHMLLSTAAGDISTRSELFRLLEEAGFIEPRGLPLPAGLGSDLQVATKPA